MLQTPLLLSVRKCRGKKNQWMFTQRKQHLMHIRKHLILLIVVVKIHVWLRRSIFESCISDFWLQLHDKAWQIKWEAKKKLVRYMLTYIKVCVRMYKHTKTAKDLLENQQYTSCMHTYTQAWNKSMWERLEELEQTHANGQARTYAQLRWDGMRWEAYD